MKRYAYQIKSLLVCLPIWLLALQLNASEANNNQTIIQEDISSEKKSDTVYFKDPTDDQTAGDAAMLFHIPGLTLTESSGQLSNAQINYRGLSNSRFSVNLEGLSLNNPITGLTDANSMFLFAANHMQTSSQLLSISLPEITEPMAKGIFGYGSQQSFKVGGMAGTKIDQHSTIFTAIQFSSTNGSFKFSSPDVGKSFIRKNNDQHRFQALTRFKRQTPTGGFNAMLAFSGHEGGIPGYAFSPTTELQNTAIYSGLLLGANKKTKNAHFSVDLTNSFFEYSSREQKITQDSFKASTHELTLKVKPLKQPAWMDIELGQQVVIEHSYELNQTRIAGGFLMSRSMKSRLFTTHAKFKMLGFHGHGLIFDKEFAISFDPCRRLGFFGRFLRKQRLPTFMELYADNQFFVGNKKLKEESIWDLELGGHIMFGDHTRLRLTGFYGKLTNVIVNTPYLSSKMRPINIDSAYRYGLDMELIIEPTNWFMFESKNSLLKTKIKENKAPLPYTPLFAGLSKVRFGELDFICATVQARYKTSSTSDIHGQVKAKAYIFTDAILSAQLFDRVSLSFAVNNIFNIKTARDTYEMPLPGTTFFTQISIGNL